jgi:hypothetical protein
MSMGFWKTTQKVWFSLVWLIQGIGKIVLGLLDWLVNVAERLIVLGTACFIFFVGWHIARGDISQGPLKESLANVPKEWPILIVFLIPLLYRATLVILKKIKTLPGGISLEEEKRETETDSGKGE